MNWQQHKEKLEAGEEVSFRPKGNSMQGKIDSGQLVTVSPDTSDVKKGDIVFCRVNGNWYVHLVQATQGDRYKIGNNKGHTNGWVSKAKIYGRVIKVED